MAECLKCEEIIRQEEFDKNEGLCEKCHKRLKLLEEVIAQIKILQARANELLDYALISYLARQTNRT